MKRRRIYLDHNASAPLLPEARQAMLDALAIDGNPSSVHDEGRRLRRLIDEARRDVAALCGAEAEHVTFTSGATEAASTLLTQDWTMGRGAMRMSRLYVSAADHPCILGGGRFPAERVTTIGVNGDGIVDLAALEAALGAHGEGVGLPLVAIHAANNETGVLQPVERIARIVRRFGGIFVTDAVQAVGRVSVDMSNDYADFLILTSHKLGGPKGAGAIVAASGLSRPVPMITGGGQERGLRGGTENVAAIAGFGAAARVARTGLADMAEVAQMRDRFEAAILETLADATIYGRAAPRLPNTIFFAIPGLKAETAQIAFDLAGVALSAGSACSSGKVGGSKVLKAMGHGDGAGALRVSIGRSTGEEELERFREALAGIAARRGSREQAA